MCGSATCRWFIEHERARTLEYFGEAVPAQAFLPGLHALEEDRRQQRLRSYYIFRRFWELTQEKGIWERLRDALTPQPENQVLETDEPQ